MSTATKEMPATSKELPATFKEPPEVAVPTNGLLSAAAPTKETIPIAPQKEGPMPATTTELPESAAAAVTEASRIAAQAARRSTETAKASIEAARSYLDDTNELGRDLLGTWATQGEATLKAAFEAETAAIDAGLSLFDLGVKGNRQAVEQFSALVKQTQQATLESWQAAVKATLKATEPARR